MIVPSKFYILFTVFENVKNFEFLSFLVIFHLFEVSNLSKKKIGSGNMTSKKPKNDKISKKSLNQKV